MGKKRKMRKTADLLAAEVKEESGVAGGEGVGEGGEKRQRVE